jgi:hypothetical protein
MIVMAYPVNVTEVNGENAPGLLNGALKHQNVRNETPGLV